MESEELLLMIHEVDKLASDSKTKIQSLENQATLMWKAIDSIKDTSMKMRVQVATIVGAGIVFQSIVVPLIVWLVTKR